VYGSSNTTAARRCRCIRLDSAGCVLERELKTDQDLHERVRGDAITIAIDHVRQATDALVLASKD
jgi:hypothetical protein